MSGHRLDELALKLAPPKYLTKPWWVDLSQVKYQTKYKWTRRGSTVLCSTGIWDTDNIRPMISVFQKWSSENDAWRRDYETIRILFLEHGDFRDTPQFKYHKNKVEHGKRSSRGSTLRELETYFHGLRDVFKSINKYGVLSQRELGGDPNDEARLHVTRAGEFCYGGMACHRIAMAELAGIKWVPFIFESVHKEWIVKVSNEFDLPPKEALLAWLSKDSRVSRKRPFAIPRVCSRRKTNYR